MINPLSDDVFASERDNFQGDHEQAMRGYWGLPARLKQFGYASLREGQGQVIDSIMRGRDTICILPTGTGKTSCFVLPSLALGWKTVVFSPLVALMRDQVQALHRAGVKAGSLSSTNTDAENHRVIQLWSRGELDFIYVAPERLRNEHFKYAISNQAPTHVVVDEAHTISQWSDNFRAEYRMIGPFVDEQRPKVVSAFTATAPPEVIGDIRRVLGISHANLVIHFPRRENLNLQSRPWVGTQELAATLRKIRGSVIVYCATQEKGVMNVSAELQRELGETEVTFFHGGLTPALKKTNQDLFMSGRTRIVVATNAFGMGIDKADIRAVIHRDIPGSLEQLTQEVGRAGRDGLPALCLSYFDAASLDTQEFFIAAGNPSRADITSVFNVLKDRAGADGVLEMTQKEVSSLAGVNDVFVNAIFSQLAGSNVIERYAPDEKIANIKFLDNPEAKGNKWGDYTEIIERGGIKQSDGSYKIDLRFLQEEAGVGMPTITNSLRDWSKSGWISYTPPFRGHITRVVGDLSRIDFGRLKRKYQLDHQKLERVKEYFNTPDEEKHNYLESYFLNQHSETK